MPNRKKTAPALVFLCVVVSAAPGFVGVARADDPSRMSCYELWYARNAIYARNGYCFNTDRAKSVFGDGCFPPYGRVRGWEKNYVNELQMWERRRGC